MDFWRENVHLLLQFQGKELLQGLSKISNKEMKNIVRERYENSVPNAKNLKHKKPMKMI